MLLQNSFTIQAFLLLKEESPRLQKTFLKCGEYHFSLIYDEDEFCGIILYWQTENFIYVEHFAISVSKRGEGLGKKALKLLIKK